MVYTKNLSSYIYLVDYVLGDLGHVVAHLLGVGRALLVTYGQDVQGHVEACSPEVASHPCPWEFLQLVLEGRALGQDDQGHVEACSPEVASHPCPWEVLQLVLEVCVQGRALGQDDQGHVEACSPEVASHPCPWEVLQLVLEVCVQGRVLLVTYGQDDQGHGRALLVTYGQDDQGHVEACSPEPMARMIWVMWRLVLWRWLLTFTPRRFLNWFWGLFFWETMSWVIRIMWRHILRRWLVRRFIYRSRRFVFGKWLSLGRLINRTGWLMSMEWLPFGRLIKTSTQWTDKKHQS
ncbi:uncharacterized protein G2W53_016992 [Senna tora]|uniref:Uncharacterized protein n=1 Tax=Senna tora TaxID=362788 RepID=A0A834WLZ9_9FABA|nr:uncharacterized protein G2W53_016992 [Senna tora]